MKCSYLIDLSPSNSFKFKVGSSESSINSELIKNIKSDGKGKVAIPSKSVRMIGAISESRLPRE
jgi:hypothetical protein